MYFIIGPWYPFKKYYFVGQKLWNSKFSKKYINLNIDGGSWSKTADGDSIFIIMNLRILESVYDS